MDDCNQQLIVFCGILEVHPSAPVSRETLVIGGLQTSTDTHFI